MTKMSFEDYLQEHGSLTYKNVGVSMEPMIKQGRDIFTLHAKGDAPCEKYDVILYKRGEDYVLHRVVGRRGDDYIVLGDNCVAKEIVSDQQVLGVLSEFVRKGRTVTVDNSLYRLYSKVWYGIYPIRRSYKVVRGKLANVKKRREKR
ncbi:MAG: S26 family signal peptidase [Eubacterium sp.]|nr:S26 family signal peptidase [Candidatus Colimonas fimequi]